MAKTAQRELRDVLGSFVTGVTVITALDHDSTPRGCTVNSFSSVSLDPPIILWSQRLVSRSFATFQQAEFFAINILAEDQQSLSDRFAGDASDKFATVQWSPGLYGSPLLDGCVAHLECRRIGQQNCGDHVVYFGMIEALKRVPKKPLVFGGGRYLSVAPREAEAASLT